jgi:CDP-diacylglycerol--glycerol-3-phosphate 3-phosphatidyltransferase
LRVSLMERGYRMRSSTPSADLRSQPGERERRWDCVTDWARSGAAVVLDPIARGLGRIGVHANAVTVLGLMLQLAVGVLLGLGHIKAGGWMLLLVAPVDAIDGAVARALGEKSAFGAFLDSTVDRLSDAALILGLTASALREGSTVEASLWLVSLVAAQMVSYVRARAESLGLTCKVGLLTRMERVVLIGVFAALGLQSILVWVFAVLSWVTLVQRLAYVYRSSQQLKEGSST